MTGVQTCALPIFELGRRRFLFASTVTSNDHTPQRRPLRSSPPPGKRLSCVCQSRIVGSTSAPPPPFLKSLFTVVSTVPQGRVP